ncbi:MAG: FMN-dependent NADH-azoreductase [Pseudomonadota bacterium]
MTTILHIASSSNLHSSVTRQIGAVTLEELKQANPSARIIERDLIKNPVPHISPDFLNAIGAAKADAPALALSEELIGELFASDIIVLEVPMYNFSIPSVLKAWIDHVARAGKTFKYGESGPQGLLTGKKVILVLGRGGVYTVGPYKVMEFQETYLRAVLGFIGLTDVESIFIEGVAMGPEKKNEALAGAIERAHSVTH